MDTILYAKKFDRLVFFSLHACIFAWERERETQKLLIYKSRKSSAYTNYNKKKQKERKKEPQKLGHVLRILVPTQKHSYTNSDNIKLPPHLPPHSPPFLKPLPHLLISSKTPDNLSKTLIQELESARAPGSLENPNSRTRARTSRRIYKARARSCSHAKATL